MTTATHTHHLQHVRDRLRPSETGALRSMRVRNYRLFAGGQVVSLTGTWMQRVAQDWLVLSLSGNSGLALGIVTGLQFLPVLLFALWGGVLADRHDKRLLLLGAQVVMAVQALVLGLLVVTGTAQLWHVYALALVLGLAAALDTPVRQAFVSELVGPDLVPNAVSLNSATFNSARIVGPAVAGLVIAAWGTGIVFLGNAASFAAVIWGLLAMRTPELFPSKRVPPAKGQLRAGLEYVRRSPRLLYPILLVFVVGTFGLNFQVTLALMSKVTFGRGADAFGLLSTALAVGSLIGALTAARRTVPRVRTMLLAGVAFGLFEVAAGFMPAYWLLLAMLVPTGFAVLTFTTAANAIVQGGSKPSMRGRVMALYILFFIGGTPIGAPLVGAVASRFGPRSSLVVGGLVCLVATVWVARRMARAECLEPVVQLRPRPQLRVRPVSTGPVDEPEPVGPDGAVTSAVTSSGSLVEPSVPARAA